MRRPLAALAATLATTVAVLAVPQAALAAGTYRNDDGTREAAVRLDVSDGTDVAYDDIALPARSVHGATAATLWVYARSADCAGSGATQYLEVNGDLVAAYDPCQVWPDTGYAWRSFTVPTSSLNDGAANTVQVRSLRGLVPTDDHQVLPRRTAYYGVDTHADGPGRIVERDLAGKRELAGIPMWYFALDGALPWIAPMDRLAFGLHDLGTPTTLTQTVRNEGLADLVVSAITRTSSDYTVVSDGCTGVTVPPGGSCTFGVTFTPSQPGSSYAQVVVRAPGATRSFEVSGAGESAPPVTTFTTADGATVVVADAVRGTVTDDSGVEYVWVSFVPELPQVPAIAGHAPLQCTLFGLSCTWSATRPLAPGRYTVTAYGVDTQGHVESPGPAPISVTVV